MFQTELSQKTFTYSLSRKACRPGSPWSGDQKRDKIRNKWSSESAKRHTEVDAAAKHRTMPKPKHAGDSEVRTRNIRSTVPARESGNQSYLAPPNGLIRSSVPHSSQRRPTGTRAKSARSSTSTVSQASAHRKVASRQMAVQSPFSLTVEQAGSFQHKLCCRYGVLTTCFSRHYNVSYICRVQYLRLCLSPCYQHLRIVDPCFLSSRELQRWLYKPHTVPGTHYVRSVTS